MFFLASIVILTSLLFIFCSIYVHYNVYRKHYAKKPSELALGKDRGPGENAPGDVKLRVNGVGETENKSVLQTNTLYLFVVQFFLFCHTMHFFVIHCIYLYYKIATQNCVFLYFVIHIFCI